MPPPSRRKRNAGSGSTSSTKPANSAGGAAPGLRRTKTSSVTTPTAARSNSKLVVQQKEEVIPKTPSSPTTTTSSTTTSTSTSTDTSWENLSQWNEESVQQVAEWWNISEQWVDKLWQLEERLRDIKHWKNQPNEVVRYLRDAHGNVKNAEAKFRRMVQWRIDYDVDNIVHDYKPPHPLMADYIPTTVLAGTDKQGDPIWLERVGAADSLGLLKAFGQPDLIRYAVYIREVCIRGEWAKDYQKQHGKPPSRATAIIDLGGMGWDHLKPSLLPLLKEGLQIIQDYYVGFGKKVIVIHCSSLFQMIWKVAKSFCGENLRNMLVFATSENYLEVLEEYVDLETLPPCIFEGGKGVGGIAMPSRLEGGKVPKLEELDRMLAKRQREQGLPDEVKTLSVSSSSLTDEEGMLSESAPSSPTSSTTTTSSRSTNSRRSRNRSTKKAMTTAMAVDDDPRNAMQPEKWTNDNFKKTMVAFCASQAEEDQVRQLHAKLKDVNHWKNSPQIIMYFLRDSNHNLKVAEKRFRQMIQWRLDNDVDHVVENYRPPKLLLDYYSTTLLRADCCDYDGDPIYVERAGATDSWSLYQRFGKEGILNYITWMRENAARGPYGEAYEKQHGRRFYGVTCVIDLHGLSARHMKPGLLPLFRSIMEVAQTHYCGMAKRIFVIRAPPILKIIWAIVQHFLNDQMKQLLVWCSTDEYEEVLNKYMNLNHLPSCIYEHGRGEGGVGMPKNLDLGRCPPPSDSDYDLATLEDLGLTAATTSSSTGRNDRGLKEVTGNDVGVKVARICGGVFDFSFSSESGEEEETAKAVVTLTR